MRFIRGGSVFNAGGYALFLFSLFLILGKVYISGDALQYHAMAESFEQTRFEVPEREEYLEPLERRFLFKIVPWQWHPAFPYPPGIALVVWPVYRAFEIFFPHTRSVSYFNASYHIFQTAGATIYILILVWAGLLFLDRHLRRYWGLSSSQTFWTLFVLILGTPLLYYTTSIPLSVHGVVFFGGALYLGLLPERGDPWWKAYMWGVCAGIGMGLAVATRYSSLFVFGPAVLIFLVYFFHKNRVVLFRYLGGMIAGGLPFVFFMMWYHTRMYGHPFTSGYAQELFIWGYPFFESMKMFFTNLIVLLVHPVRGLFVWHPLLLLAFYGIFMVHTREKKMFFLVPFFVFFLFLAFYHDWWAGVSCGQRLFSDVLPFFAGPLGVVLARKRRLRWLAVVFTFWNVFLTFAFIGGAWKGYDDGRLGERYPVTHLVQSFIQKPEVIVKSYLAETIENPNHILKLAHIRGQLRKIPSYERRQIVTKTMFRFALPQTEQKVVQVVFTLYAQTENEKATWFASVLSERVTLTRGIHYWTVKIGLPLPFIDIELDDTPLSFIRHHEYMGGFIEFQQVRNWKSELALYVPDEKTYKMYAWKFRIGSPWIASVNCRKGFYSYFIQRLGKFSIPEDGYVWLWAQPYLEKGAWFQTTRVVRKGEELVIPFLPAQILRQAYVGPYIVCFVPRPS